MRRFVQVIPFLQNTAVFLRATVANIGRDVELVTDFLFIGRTRIVTTTAQSASARTVGFVRAKLNSMAIFALNTPFVWIILCKLFAFLRPFFYFTGNGRFAFTELFCDAFEGVALFQQDFNLQAFSVC